MLDPLFLGRGGAIVPVLTDELGRVLSLNSMILKRVRVLWTEAVQGSASNTERGCSHTHYRVEELKCLQATLR
ncbi:hypothetical protein CIK65_09630 [Brevibacterium aurantiacum]|uniref:Uncharacterized protein n=1 Tax=Brevibacterium aurantiacum TaxID=273384 RepID=A0A2A3YVB8_BREAU|nr:hypothetical protein CIK65_09630 [Brevibacterium aurantiacum]